MPHHLALRERPATRRRARRCGRVLSASVSSAALVALEQDESTPPIGAFWNNVLMIKQVAVQMAEQNPALDAIRLNRGHFFLMRPLVTRQTF
jgi:hypothetical protein